MSAIDNRIIEALRRQQLVTEYIVYPFSDITDYQVLFTNVPSSSKEDVLVVLNKKILPHWVESIGNVWIKVPKLVKNTPLKIYILTGNPSTISVSNGANIFDFFDDFLGSSVNSNIWTSSGSITATVSNSVLSVDWTGTGYLYSNIVKGIPYSVRTRTNIAASSSDAGSLSNLRMAGVPTDIVPTNQFIVAFTHLTTGNYRWWASASGATSYENTNLAMNGAYHIFETSVIAGTIKHSIDNVLQITDTTDIPSVNMTLGFSGQTNGGTILTDWILVRKYISPEPIVKKIKTINKSLLLKELMR